MVKFCILFGLLSKVICAQQVDTNQSSADNSPDHKCCCTKTRQYLSARSYMQIPHAFLGAEKHPALGEIVLAHVE